MPIGAPAHRPAPKSGCSGKPAPIVFTYAVEPAASGRLSTGAFQMLSEGNTLHGPKVWAGAGSSNTGSDSHVRVAVHRMLTLWIVTAANASPKRGLRCKNTNPLSEEATLT